MKQAIAVSLRTLLAAAIVLALAFGARQARASSMSCLSCHVWDQQECEECSWAQNFAHGMCPSSGVPCLCWDD